MNAKVFAVCAVVAACAVVCQATFIELTAGTAAALTIPAITGISVSSGALALGALGAAKLIGAAALGGIFAASRGGRRRGRRAANELSSEAFWEIAGLLDNMDCAKLLICHLEAKPAEFLEDDEKLILALFGDLPAQPEQSSVGTFQQAALVGKQNRSNVACTTKYANCPVSAGFITTILRASN